MAWYAQRNASGNVIGLFANPQPQNDGSDLTDGIPLADDHPEVVAFLNPPAPSAAVREADCVASFNGGVPVGTLDIFKLVKAKALSDLAYRLGKAVGQLTNQEITTERDRLASIYKAL